MSKMTNEEKQFVDSVLKKQETIKRPENQNPPDEQDAMLNKALEGLETLKESLPMAQEYMKLNAILTKSKYDTLIDQGFTKEQALELCKKLF